MHTKDSTGDSHGGSWTLRLGMVVVGISLAWSLTGPSAAAAEPCALAIIGSCPDDEQPAPPTTTTTTAAPAPPPEVSSAEAAARLLSLLNDERANAGLAPFTVRADVTEIAVGWSTAMARSEHLSHNDDYFTTDTRARLDARMLGENVARNPSVDGAHRALMASPPHRANILDGRFVVIGIGAELRNGSWWVTQDFLQPSTAAPAPPRAAGAPTAAPAAAPSTTAPRPGVASTKPTTPKVAPGAAPAADAGEVLAATASAPSIADLSAPQPSTTHRDVASSPDSTSSLGAVAAVGAVAAALLALALVLAYRVSWTSAFERIRCR